MDRIEEIRRRLWQESSLDNQPTVWHTGVNGTCRRELPSPLDRFLDLMGITADEDDCWPWLGRVNEQGYGVFACNGRKHVASRLAYEQWIGPIGRNMQLRQECGFRLCTNRRHLYILHRTEVRCDVSEKQPQRISGEVFSDRKEEDMAGLIAAAHGLGYPFAHSNHPDCRAMYDLLAEEFGITRNRICAILTGASWRHLERPWPVRYRPGRR